ncbi:MAG: hypothetical protein LDL07_00195 [Desulfarculus sp.]|nr:hypothetical protein [Desulfarculus sp.]
MKASSPRYLVMIYLYVKEHWRREFPGLNGLTRETLQTQLAFFLSSSREIATLESALASARGAYQSRQDLCLLTFDDDLANPYHRVTSLLADRGLQGLFFLNTRRLTENTLTLVHQSYLPMAESSFDAYRRAVEAWLGGGGLPLTPQASPDAIARADSLGQPAVKDLKYLINFELPPDRGKLSLCASALRANLSSPEQWPFSYPHGKADTSNADTRRALTNEDFIYGPFSVPGAALSGADLFSLQRIDASSVDPQAGHVTC